MAEWEQVPVGANEGDWWSWSDADRDQYLLDAFEGITRFDADRRHLHDSNGYMAYQAGSEQCRALGHVHPPDGWGSDGEGHPRGWVGFLCRATQTGTACTWCEGECEYQVEVDVLWPALARAAARHAEPS